MNLPKGKKLPIIKRSPIIFGLLVVVLIVLGFEIIYYVSLQIKKSTLQRNSPFQRLSQEEMQKINQRLNQTHDKFLAAAAELKDKEEPLASDSACFRFQVDPTTGSDAKFFIDENYGIFDFNYDGVLNGFGEVIKGECSYWQMKFKQRGLGNEYWIFLPKGMVLKNSDVGQVTGAVLRSFIDQEIEIKLRWHNLNYGNWELLEWNYLRFYNKSS